MDRYKKGFVEEPPAGYCAGGGAAPWKDTQKHSQKIYSLLRGGSIKTHNLLL